MASCVFTCYKFPFSHSVEFYLFSQLCLDRGKHAVLWCIQVRVTAHCTLPIAHYTLPTAHYTLPIAHCSLNIAHCTLHIAGVELHQSPLPPLCSLYSPFCPTKLVHLGCICGSPIFSLQRGPPGTIQWLWREAISITEPFSYLLGRLVLHFPFLRTLL